MILGIDIGNYSVKTSNKTSFISKISDIYTFDEEKKIIIDGSDYFIEEGEFSTDWNKSRKDNTIPLLYSALAKEDDNYFKVILGLPIGQYKQNKENLKRTIEDNRFKTVIYKGVKKDILITDVMIAPEGAATYYNLVNEQKEMIGNKQLLIVDIGGRTTDISLFKDKKILEVKTIPVGMLNVYRDIVDEINRLYTPEFKLEEGEEVLKEGLFLDGEYKDKSFIIPILQRHFNSIYKELQLQFNPAKGYISLTGGGSIVFRQAFKNRLNNVIEDSDPIYSNALGFYKLGLKMWEE